MYINRSMRYYKATRRKTFESLKENIFFRYISGILCEWNTYTWPRKRHINLFLCFQLTGVQYIFYNSSNIRNQPLIHICKNFQIFLSNLTLWKRSQWLCCSNHLWAVNPQINFCELCRDLQRLWDSYMSKELTYL